jgi:hypothetical protein
MFLQQLGQTLQAAEGGFAANAGVGDACLRMTLVCGKLDLILSVNMRVQPFSIGIL